MKRKFFALLLALLMASSLILSASASEVLPMVVDEAGLFSPEEAADLEERALALRETYEMDVVILTLNSLEGSRPQDYADDYFDYNGYGSGENASGILFLLSMEERDLYVSTVGDAIYVLTDYGLELSTEVPLPYFGEEDYYGGFVAWLEDLVYYFDAYAAGTPIDGEADYSDGYYHGDQEDIAYYDEEVTPSVFLSLILGLIVAAVTVLIMRLSMNTKTAQRSAASYLTAGTYRLRTQQDLFLYSNVTKTARPKNTSSGSGGGSSVHRSSSGRTHGGGGRKF